MAIISVIDNQNNRWKRNAKKTTKQNKKNNKKGDRSYSERVKPKWFFCVFRFDFLQLICQAFLVLSRI